MKICSSVYSRLSSILLLTVATAAGAHATTIGISTSSFDGNKIDSCTSCSYIVPIAFGMSGTVSSYTLHAGGTGDITPILLNGTVNGNGTTTFTITGIGTLQSDDNVTGNQTFNFGLTSGSDAVTATTYFGWFDINGPLVTFTYDAPGAGTFLFAGSDTVGQAYTLENTSQDSNTQNALNDRIYDINATSVAPEPSSLLLLGTGMAGIAGLLRRRFAA